MFETVRPLLFTFIACPRVKRFLHAHVSKSRHDFTYINPRVHLYGYASVCTCSIGMMRFAISSLQSLPDSIQRVFGCSKVRFNK